MFGEAKASYDGNPPYKPTPAKAVEKGIEAGLDQTLPF